MALSPQLQQFKSSGVYRLEFDKSQTVNIPTETIRLVVGRSNKGPYNTPVLIENTEQFVQIFGGIDNSLERKGMFFHRSALEALSRGPILAMNITTKDANDLISGFSPVTAGGDQNLTAIPLTDEFSKAFDTGKFWTPSDEKVLVLAGNTAASSKNAITFVNIKQDPITVIIRQALNTDGFNITAREFYGEGEVPEGIDNLEFISDYMVDVLVFKGKFNSTELNNDPTYGALFTSTGIRKNSLAAFTALREVELLAQYTGSLIPEFVDNEGRQLYIETIINREARRTGLFAAVNEEAVKNIDLIGNGFDIYAEDDFELLSHVVTAGVDDEPNTRAVLFPDSTWTFENKGAGVFTMAKTVANSALEPYFNPDYTSIGDEEMHIKVGMSVQTGGDQNELARIKQIKKLTPNVVSGVGSATFDEGVVINGTQGEEGAQTVFTVPVDAPNSLQYYCTNHPLAMGNDLAITSIKETFAVTTTPNPDDSEGGAIYQIDGENKPVLNLVRGGVYTFDQSDSSNTNHPLKFRVGSATAFTEGVITTGIPGQPGAKTVFTVPLDAPLSLRYYCTVHGNGMGNTITLANNESKSFNVTVVNVGGINIYQIDGVNKPVLNLVRGGVYTFDQSDTTNETHPLRFRLGVGTTYAFEFVCHRNVEEAPEYALKTFEAASNVYKMFPINGAVQTEKKISELLAMLKPGNGLSNTLIDKDAIDLRYVVDTFASLEADTILNKGEIAELCKERQNASAILNAPMVKELKASTNPSFMNEFTGEFETRFVKTGGNINLNPTSLYTLPSINEGANYAFYYGPGLNVLENGKTKVIPPAAYVSNNYIDKYTDSLPWSIIAGPRRGAVGGTGVQGVEFAFDKNDRDVLEPFGYNPIVFERGVGIVIKGNKTAQQSVQSALSSAHVREAMIFIEDGLAAILQNYLFEFNNAQTRLEIQTLADNFMESVKKDGGVFDYRNIMDTTNNTNEIIDNNIGILDTFVEPVKGLEILVSRVTILNTGEIATGNFA